MNAYYLTRLSGKRLQQVYELAPERIRKHLSAEIRYVMERIHEGDAVLELGCGYGRVLKPLLGKAGTVVGIDISADSLALAREYVGDHVNCHLFKMNAVTLGFADGQFDVVLCLENGLSTFRVNKRRLVREAMRVTRPGGVVIFSTYAKDFWEPRLEWMELQARRGLVGEIDQERTGSGTIMCKDGHRIGLVTPEDFIYLLAEFNTVPRVVEVDSSGVIFEIHIRNRAIQLSSLKASA